MSKFKTPILIDERGSRILDLSQIPEVVELNAILKAKRM